MTNPVCGSCGAPTGDGAALCQGCTGHLAQALALAASIAPDLDDAVARLMVRGDRGPRGSEPPLPLDLAASEAKEALRQSLAWAALGIGTGHAFTPREIVPAAQFLLARLGIIRQYPLAAEMLADIRHRVSAAVAVVDRRPERTPAGTCEQCGQQLLAELGADEVKCGCGMLAVALNAKRRERAAAADVLGTPGEISGALYSLGIVVSASTIRTWASRGRLAQRPGGTPERPVYAMSEVMSLCAQRSSRG